MWVLYKCLSSASFGSQCEPLVSAQGHGISVQAGSAGSSVRPSATISHKTYKAPTWAQSFRSPTVHVQWPKHGFPLSVRTTWTDFTSSVFVEKEGLQNAFTAQTPSKPWSRLNLETMKKKIKTELTTYQTEKKLTKKLSATHCPHKEEL